MNMPAQTIAPKGLTREQMETRIRNATAGQRGDWALMALADVMAMLAGFSGGDVPSAHAMIDLLTAEMKVTVEKNWPEIERQSTPARLLDAKGNAMNRRLN